MYKDVIIYLVAVAIVWILFHFLMTSTLPAEDRYDFELIAKLRLGRRHGESVSNESGGTLTGGTLASGEPGVGYCQKLGSRLRSRLVTEPGSERAGCDSSGP